MAKFKNIKKGTVSNFSPVEPEFKLIKPLAGPVKEGRKPEPQVKKLIAPKALKETLVKKTFMKPKRVGIFMTILFVTIVLQVVLLVSLLYLSPSLIIN